ncbi:TPA: DEAD/DEAH box helicase, partial [Pseudomonas aeruginosa]
RDDNAKTVAIYFTAPAEEWDLAVARRLRHQLHSWESVGHLVQLHLLESTVSSLPRDQKEWLAKLAFNGVQICLHNSIPDLGALALNVSLQGPQGCIAWASDNTNLAAPGHTWDLAEAGARIIRGTPSDLKAERILNAADLMPAPPPGLIKIEIGNQLDGSLDNFARRFWEHLGTEANGLINDALTGKDPITELVYSDRYVCSPLVVNLLVSVIHELGRLSDADFAIRILGRQYQRGDNRSPWQYRHDWHSARERDEALRQALAYCGREGEVLSLPTLPHYRRLQLKLRSGNQLTIQFDQGLSYWEAERSEKSYQLRFDFASRELGEEIMEHIRCKVSAAGEENTQIFLSSS